MDFQALRLDYSSKPLTEDDSEPQPEKQFQLWLQEAIASEISEPNAFVLTTNGLDGFPSARVLLLKEALNGRFVFFSNYESQKGRELEASALASMLFFWQPLFRQVRIKGLVSKISRKQSAQYFSSRPRGAQLSAWSSPQSKTIEDRRWLDQEYARVEQQFTENIIPCPEFWGGYQLVPSYFEFWQGRESRRHDRIAYKITAEENWKKQRLAP